MVSDDQVNGELEIVVGKSTIQLFGTAVNTTIIINMITNEFCEVIVPAEEE